MRMSCNGCRVLRKGCSENCTIRPCLQWIKSSASQANATVFLAKFYGRAGLINLLNAAGPQHPRPAIFRSLLYEACGRILNPIYGSAGLLWSGNWQLCQAAVEAVLKGAPITQLTSEAAGNTQGPPLKPYDIRHVSKDETNSSASPDLHKVIKTRCRFKKTAVKPLLDPVQVDFSWNRSGDVEFNRPTSHDSSVSHPQEAATESMESGETAEAEPETSAHKPSESPVEDDGLGLELTLGIEPVSRVGHVKKLNNAPSYGDKCRLELKLE